MDATKLAQLEAEAHRMNDADANAQRCYRVATIQDLRTWLSPVPLTHPILDTWTVQRRVGLMRRELAKREAELCMSSNHFDAFGEHPDENVAGHVAAHLAQLRGQSSVLRGTSN